jgi:hypothetical protein
MVNAALAGWLVMSTLLGPHDGTLAVSGILAGVLTVIAALATMRGHAWGRYLGAAVGAWLVLSPMFFVADSLFDALNAPVVGTAIALLALWPEHTQGEPLLTSDG